MDYAETFCLPPTSGGPPTDETMMARSAWQFNYVLPSGMAVDKMGRTGSLGNLCPLNMSSKASGYFVTGPTWRKRDPVPF